MATMTTTDTSTTDMTSTDTTPSTSCATAIDQLHTGRAQRSSAAVRLVERGLTTAEYAVGILGAMAAGLLLFRLFSDNGVFEMLFELITKVLNHVTGLI